MIATHMVEDGIPRASGSGVLVPMVVYDEKRGDARQFKDGHGELIPEAGAVLRDVAKPVTAGTSQLSDLSRQLYDKSKGGLQDVAALIQDGAKWLRQPLSLLSRALQEGGPKG